MKKTSFYVLVSLLLGTNLMSQNLTINENKIALTKPSKVINETEKRGVSSSVHIFESTDFQKVDDSYVLKFETSSGFTTFGIGWNSSDNSLLAGKFKIAFKTEIAPNRFEFGEIKTGEGEVTPSENTTGLYWSELFFGYDESTRKQLFIIITPPAGVTIDKIQVDVMDLSKEIDPSHGKNMGQNSEKSVVCPAVPTIIQRADWCGSYTACTNAAYTPTVITPTHTVIHHGASPDTYTDGYAVVRSYWNYHVNTLGWSDIGYNYLFDKFGNVFLGRKNANYLTQDVRGSHAGNSNSSSIGVNFLGNGDVTLPTTIQLQKVYGFLGWWYNSRNINPTSDASIILQSGGTATLTRIIGHKDVNIGGTACPGTTIYGLLGTIRTEVTAVINACTTILPVSNLQSQVGACPTNQVVFSWTNSGSGWYIQVSNSSTFSAPYIKYVSNLTTFTGPTGFVLQSDGVSPLTLNAGQTYFWRIWDNTSFVSGTSFSMNSAPSQPSAISGTASVCSGTTNTYSISAVTNATSYTWSTPTGSTISSGQNTTSIAVSSGTSSGLISVTASNSCGTSAASTFYVTSLTPAPSQPSAISGTVSVCSGTTNTYSISAVTNATSYTWSTPTGSTISSGQNTTSIAVSSGTSSGLISVTASNSCGTSAANSISITANSCNDVTKPTTIVTNPSWVTTNFTANFNDADNAGGSGLKYRFYQVTDLNGTERRANKNFGFFNDNFNSTIHADWTALTGTWAIASGALTQQDATTTNSNLYASVPQVSGNQYLYNWKMKISGTGANRRAGLHFFCEDATQSNRLNSYLVYFRADGSVAQIYKYLNNVMSLKAEASCTIIPGTQYDYKVVLNTVSGEINIYQNNVLIVSWTDSTPLTVGNQVSLRNAECTVEYDDFRIFKSRSSSAIVTAGNSLTNEIRYQNATLASSSGNITSITTDVAKNISIENTSVCNLDFWGPYVLPLVNDGTAADLSSQSSLTSISANWPATSDPNNTITSYSYAIGTSPGAINISNWTSIGNNVSFTRTGLTLVTGTTYYISVKSTNAAGLVSAVKNSNGVLAGAAVTKMLLSNSILTKAPFEINVYPNPVEDLLTISGLENNMEIKIYNLTGQKMIFDPNLENNTIDVSDLTEGIYILEVILNNERIQKKFVKN